MNNEYTPFGVSEGFEAFAQSLEAARMHVDGELTAKFGEHFLQLVNGK